MKIIKDNSKSSFPRQITCERVEDKNGLAYGAYADFCGSIIEIEAEDVKKHSWAMWDDSGVDYGVICPVCGKFIAIKEDTISCYIKEKALETSLRGE